MPQSNKCRRLSFIQCDRTSLEHCPVLFQHIVIIYRNTHITPVYIPVHICKGECAYTFAILINLRAFFYFSTIACLDLITLIRRTVNSRRKPSILTKFDRSQKHLSSKMMERIPQMNLPKSQSHEEPFSILSLYQIAMSDSLNNIRRFIPVSQHRITRTTFKRPPYRSASCACHHVSIFRTALCCHQIIPVANVIHMRAFQIPSTCTLPYRSCIRKLTSGGHIYLTLIDHTFSICIGTIAYKIYMSLIKQKRRIDTVLLHNHRLGPIPIYIICINVIILIGRIIVSNHIEPSFMKPDRRRKYAP